MMGWVKVPKRRRTLIQKRLTLMYCCCLQHSRLPFDIQFSVSFGMKVSGGMRQQINQIWSRRMKRSPFSYWWKQHPLVHMRATSLFSLSYESNNLVTVSYLLFLSPPCPYRHLPFTPTFTVRVTKN